MKFYIADPHFGHENVIHYDNRPFKTVQEMDEEMIRRWNAVVGPTDEVYILGDFCWQTERRWETLLIQLNGIKTLIKGNHDITPSRTRKLFADVNDYKEINDNGRKVVLCHYPIPCFNKHYYGAYHLYGHVHNSFEYNMMEHDRYLMEELYTQPCKMYNVGAMMEEINYTPRTLDQILEGYDIAHRRYKKKDI